MTTAAKSGPPYLGLHILIGEQAGVKLRNMYDNAKGEIIAPVMFVSRKPEYLSAGVYIKRLREHWDET